jgi:uncharacterized protein
VSKIPSILLISLLISPLISPVGPPGLGAGLTERPTATSSSDTALVLFGSDTIHAEVADEFSEWSQGLKGRTSVPDGTGLLFVFDEPRERSFWMVDTLIDLDIAFMDAAFRITRIATMQAGSEDLTDSPGPAPFALEVRAGWFAEKGIRAGDVPEVVFDSTHGLQARTPQ